MIGHWLNRTLQVWRPTRTQDGAGGYRTVYVRQPSDVRAKVDQPSDAERLLAVQTQSEQTDGIYLLPTDDVRRGDELRDPDSGEVWRVAGVMRPSSVRYRKAHGELVQSEGETNG
ncbi:MULTISPECIES: head-tail adaptor protein [Protofrankia]|uniref:Head-tail adaptor protein n=1 Tax=Protofrankia coriariae TaxID=1562887 RepID=A0ABR5F4G9_9ACTN|nr:MULTISPECIES: head-tail adaptor protein [Protofrankia]KLL11584.1 head-tail adaptor protein [Protofrankia coriariae]ONH35720.1 head-tail adaptor protein [Protofrankia sp. BMG5.30]